MVFRLALAWGCTPREVLDRISSEDLAEWVAFENVHGPIDGTYERIVLNEIHLQLQTLNYLFGAANFTNEEEGIDNPIPEPKKMPLPWEMAEEAAKAAKENAWD